MFLQCFSGEKQDYSTRFGHYFFNDFNHGFRPGFRSREGQGY